MILNRPHVRLQSRRIGYQSIARFHLTTRQGPGHHRAHTFWRKSPVDSQARLAEIPRRGSLRQDVRDRFLQLIHAQARRSRHWHDGCAFQCRTLKIICQHLGHKFQILAQVRLGQGHDEIGDPEVTQNLQVLL